MRGCQRPSAVRSSCGRHLATLRSYAGVSAPLLRVLCSSRPPLPASSSLPQVCSLLCLSNSQAPCSFLRMMRVEMTALNALSLTIVTGRWMLPEHHVLPRGQGASFSAALNSETGLLQIHYALPAKPARASGDEGVCLQNGGFQRPFDGRHRTLRRTSERCCRDCFPMIHFCSSRAMQLACLVAQDHTGRGREPAALHSRRRRAAISDLVSLLQDKNPQRTIGERWSRICVVVSCMWVRRLCWSFCLFLMASNRHAASVGAEGARPKRSARFVSFTRTALLFWQLLR